MTAGQKFSPPSFLGEPDAEEKKQKTNGKFNCFNHKFNPFLLKFKGKLSFLASHLFAYISKRGYVGLLLKSKHVDSQRCMLMANNCQILSFFN